jgi:hypothetical protein
MKELLHVKTVSITYSERMCVALGIQHKIRIFMKYYIGFDKFKRQIEIPVKIEYIWKHFERRKIDVSALFLAKLVEQLAKRKLFITYIVYKNEYTL